MMLTAESLKHACEGLPSEVQRRAMKLIAAIKKSASTNRLQMEYAGVAKDGHPGGPYEWQQEFHDVGEHTTERAIFAGNRTGKTRTCAAEVATHLTGLYPDWWRGRRFNEPTRWIVASPTNETTRDICQAALFGGMEEGERVPDGTGWIPKSCIQDFAFRQCGVVNVMDYAKVKHVTGGSSMVSMKTYEMGDVKFQGVSRHGVWLDEEPPDHKIYSECQMRILDENGLLMLSRTPLFGLSETVEHFFDGTPGTWYIQASWDEAPHLDEEARKRMLELIPEHERETRMAGDPLLGSGLVYPIAQSVYTCRPFKIPNHFARITGIDFGIGHPFAACWIAHDRDNDIAYLYDVYKMAGEAAPVHAQALLARGNWPVAFPHDGYQRDKGSGEQVIQPFIDAGCNVLPLSARFDDAIGGPQSRERGTGDVLDRMKTGRFRVFEDVCQPFLKEVRSLHRKDGVIVDIKDDAESANRYALMMLRYAVTYAENMAPMAMIMHQSSTGTDDYSPLSRY